MVLTWGLCCLDKKIAGNKETISNIINMKSELITDIVTPPSSWSMEIENAQLVEKEVEVILPQSLSKMSDSCTVVGT